MKARLQGVEGEATLRLNDKLSVNDKAIRSEAAEERHDFRKVAPKRLTRLGPEFHSLPRPEGYAAKAVPFGLVLPAGAFRQRQRSPCLHRRNVERKVKAIGSGSLCPLRPRSPPLRTRLR